MNTHCPSVFLQMGNILILDFGNTYQKCAVVVENECHLSIFEHITQSDIETIAHNFDISRVILSSVIHHSVELKTWLNQRFQFIELDENTPIPLKNKYLTPNTLGKDRLAAAVGAFSMFPGQNVLVVDCGTAIKYDLVTAEGEYLGGGISPGLHLRFKALHTFTDKLPLVSFTHVPDLIGNNTVNSISSGVINGVIAEIDGIIQRYTSQFENLNVVLTGGEMIYFEKSLKSIIFAAPNLVLKGLHQILLFNERK